MGFYGNITDTSHTYFQFDKIFTSRKDMDIAAATGKDGIFAGRFVLVKYDPESNFFQGDILQGYKKNNEIANILYVDAECEAPYIFTTFSQVLLHTAENWNQYYQKVGDYYFKLPGRNYYDLNGEYYIPDVSGNNLVTTNQLLRLYTSNIYYKCLSGTVGEPAVWEIVQYNEDDPPYILNYNIDKIYYGNDFDIRGYDATVWEKVYDGQKGKFILIAYLNALVPSLELQPLAPSMIPSAPYIDGSSASAVYKVHVPTNWGLQVKEATNTVYSDQTMIRQRIQVENNEETTIVEEIPADIYFNAKGATKQLKYDTPSINNELILTPTGKSGKVYYDKNGNQVEEDTLEWGLHFPALGNMVSDGYDLIYGSTSNQDATTGAYIRPTDITFYPGDSTDNLKYNGNSLLGGKTYNLDTLAGTLNTMHNKLGQIIVPLSGSYNIADLSEDMIYFRNNKYWRKGKVYIPEDVDDMFTYEKVNNLTQEEFQANKYYYNTSGNNNTYYPATEYNATIAAYTQSNKGYFLKKINQVRYQEITLIPFVSGQYYLKENEGYYQCDNSTNPALPYDPDRTYYTITNSLITTLRTNYVADGSFYVKDGYDYLSYAELNPDLSLTFYKIENYSSLGEQVYYHKGVYYYQDEHDTSVYHLDTNDEPTLNREYYIIRFDMEHPQYGMVNGTISMYYPTLGDPQRVGQLLHPSDIENYFFMVDNDFISYKSLATMEPIEGYSPYVIKREYFKINQVSEPLTSQNIFMPGVYWQKNSNNDYYKSYDWDETENYYSIEATMIGTPFYVPDRYYYKVSTNPEEYDKDMLLTMTHDHYYTKKRLFVLHDTYGVCPYGYEWSDYSAYIPPSITLYTRTEGFDLIELKGFEGNGENTIHGMLLKLNKLYNTDDEETRELDSLKGALNSVRDILYQIQTLRPGHILYVNDFGQITSSPITYDQLAALI